VGRRARVLVYWVAVVVVGAVLAYLIITFAERLDPARVA
jgi:hypothetical protein